MPSLNRRTLLVTSASLGLVAALPISADELPPIHVVKDPGCGCCAAWVDHLKAKGFAVTVDDLGAVELAKYKIDSGIPQDIASCHTGKIDGYMIEGHVPAADIRRLLQDRPDAIGLAVPGMPMGSPGMGDESAREAYDVYLIARDGTTTVFASYPAA